MESVLWLRAGLSALVGDLQAFLNYGQTARHGNGGKNRGRQHKRETRGVAFDRTSPAATQGSRPAALQKVWHQPKH
jgi:hypothetical protein